MFRKEITPKELRKLNSKSFRKIQKKFRQRLRKIAANGDNRATYDEREYHNSQAILSWLKSLGFTCKRVSHWTGLVEITWPESLSEKEIVMLTKPKRGRVWYAHPDSKPIKDGKSAWYFHHWDKDAKKCDFICSCCNEHSNYETKFCPNCGARMLTEEEER